MNRRKFLMAGLGSVLAGARLTQKRLPDLPPILPEKRTGRQKIALIYSNIDLTTREGVNELAAMVMGGAAGSIAGNLLYDRQGKITRREFMDALPDVAGSLLATASTEAMAQFVEELRLERESIDKLHQDLEAKGYQVFTTHKGSTFMRLLQAASKNRPKDAKTMVFVDAHGAAGPDEFELETDEPQVGREGTYRIHSQSLAHAIGDIPGHTLLGMSACHAHVKEFLTYPGFKPKLTFITNTLGDWRNKSYLASPFFRSLRIALRRPGGIAENAVAAYYRHEPSLIARVYSRLFTHGMRAERVNHDEPFIP